MMPPSYVLIVLQKLEEVLHLEEKLETSKYKIDDLENQLEEKSLILLNARKALKQERDKLKVVSEYESLDIKFPI